MTNCIVCNAPNIDEVTETDQFDQEIKITDCFECGAHGEESV